MFAILNSSFIHTQFTNITKVEFGSFSALNSLKESFRPSVATHPYPNSALVRIVKQYLYLEIVYVSNIVFQEE